MITSLFIQFNETLFVFHNDNIIKNRHILLYRYPILRIHECSGNEILINEMRDNSTNIHSNDKIDNDNNFFNIFFPIMAFLVCVL